MTRPRYTSGPIGGDHPPVGTRAVFELRTPILGERFVDPGWGIVTATHDYRWPRWVLVGILESAQVTPGNIDTHRCDAGGGHHYLTDGTIE